MLNWLKQLFTSVEKPKEQVSQTPSQPVYVAPPSMLGSAELKKQGDDHLARGDMASAATCYRKALVIDPDFAKAHSNLGFVLMQQGRADEAERSLKQALALDPKNADTCFMLGNLAILSRSDLESGCQYFQKAVELMPDFDVAYLDWRRYMSLQGKLEQVKQFLITGIASDPARADFQNYLGNIYQDEQQFEQAIACFQQALAIRPDDADVLENLGFVLFKQNQVSQANAAYDKALALRRQAALAVPDDLDLHYKLATLLLVLNRHQEAIASFNQILALNPGYVEARLGRGLTSLLIGEFETGWKDTKDLASYAAVGYPEFRQPLWLNDRDINGKSILLFADQGLGDTIQFVRYAEQIKKLGAKVYVRAHTSLKSLLGTLAYVDGVFGEEDILPLFDYCCPLSNVALAFNTSMETIPAGVPYLQAAKDRVAYWENQLSSFQAPRIGIVWSGNPLFRNDKNRSVHLQRLAALLMDGSRHFFLLQKEVRALDAPFMASLKNVTDLGSQLNDFAETAAVIANLDLVITVDTSVAHLAGALGKPVWILLPFAPDFRWLLGRKDSPWYPTARLFRQPTIANWDTVLDEIRHELDREFPVKRS
ncbi:tetratricopeptide repeat protein [Undibacterium sp. Ji49W]|uniref:tetratricopeptide repeat-containing glycosyltransferase family protein n=1 Tax=Undibacterium sp. Ji49W TaxID=3413040 RepID=UPI003BF06335